MDPAAVETLRAHLRTLFPPLTAPCPPAFFDNAAGSLVPRTVIEAVSQVLLERGVVNSLPGYPWGRANSLLKVAAHEATALFVNAPGGAKDVALGPSATALTFRVSAALARRLRPGDAVVCSELEHECNASPWRELSRVGVELRVWRAAWPGGALPLEGLRALLADGKVKLVALTAASNCFGLRTDVAGAAAVAHAAGAEIFVDAVHAAAHALPDVVRDDVDYLCFSPYKLCAPHLGALYVRSSLVAALDVPTLFFYDKSCLSKAEYGTAPYESLAGWMASLHYYQEEVGGGERGAPLTRAGLVAAFDAVVALEAPLKRALLEGLVALPGVEVFGSHALEDRVGTVAFRVRGVTPEAVALQLGERGICVGNGNFYALLPNEALGLLEGGGVVRASMAHYNTMEEVQRLLSEVEKMAA